MRCWSQLFCELGTPFLFFVLLCIDVVADVGVALQDDERRRVLERGEQYGEWLFAVHPVVCRGSGS